LDESVKLKIEHEISRIEKLVNEIEPLIKLCKLKEPDIIEKSAAALMLHSFYNGIESILILFFKYKNIKLPNDTKWHKTLFEMAFGNNPENIIIFDDEIKKDLEKCLLYRHFIRHTYGSELDWEQMKPMVYGINEIWNKIKIYFNKFINKQENENIEKVEQNNS